MVGVWHGPGWMTFVVPVPDSGGVIAECEGNVSEADETLSWLTFSCSRGIVLFHYGSLIGASTLFSSLFSRMFFLACFLGNVGLFLVKTYFDVCCFSVVFL